MHRSIGRNIRPSHSPVAGLSNRCPRTYFRGSPALLRLTPEQGSHDMNLKQTRLVTNDVLRLTGFYEELTGATADVISAGYVEFQRSPCAGLAITSAAAAAIYGEDVLASANNRSLVLDFEVSDVDAHYTRLRERVDEWVQLPTDLPWGNRAMLFRDPDGNLVNMFAVKRPPANE
jgi:uncharacterized glyoxalase superfamily protein PhnB